MISKSIIKKIIEQSIYAPSGDNLQPWKFVVSGNTIKLYNLAQADKSLYNFKEFGSYLANGAVAENILISASHYGYRADILPFPNQNDFNLTAVITLIEDSHIPKDTLFDFIKIRATNRTFYKKIPLPIEIKTEIEKIVNNFKSCQIKIIEDAAKKDALSQALSLNDRLILENQTIHKILFNHILWTEKEAKKKKKGLDVRTLELKGPKLFIFKLFKSDLALKILTKIGFSKIIVKEARKLYNSASAIGALIIDNDFSENYFNAGRCLQRIWLTLTKNGLSLHPITGIPYLAKRILAGNTQHFSAEQSNEIIMANEKILNIFEIKDKKIAMVFRFGFGDTPSAFSPRQTPKIIFQ